MTRKERDNFWLDDVPDQVHFFTGNITVVGGPMSIEFLGYILITKAGWVKSPFKYFHLNGYCSNDFAQCYLN